MMHCEVCGKESKFLVSCKGFKTKLKLCCVDCLHKTKKVAKS